MHYEVTEADTAAVVGSGDVPVLATPRLIAWMEAATVRSAAPFVSTGQTTVGTAVRIEHRRATRIGGRVEITAEPSATTADGLTFSVRAVDAAGKIVADGEIERMIVDRARFCGKETHAEAE